MILALRKKTKIVSAILFILLLGFLLYINIPFLMPFLIAGIFSLGFDDFITRATTGWKIPRWLIIIFILFSGFALFWAPLTLATYRMVNIFHMPDSLNTSHISEQLGTLKVYTMELVQKISKLTGLDITSPIQDGLESFVKKVGEIILSLSSNLIRSTPSIAFNGLVFSIFLFSLSIRPREIRSFVLKYSPLNELLTQKVIKNLKESCSLTLYSTFIIGLIQAGIVILGSLIFGEGDFWIVMPVTCVLAFIPVIGAGPMGFLLSVLAFIGNRIIAGIGMLVFSTVASTIDNILKPMLIGGKDLKISPVLTFTCVVGAMITFGIPGVLIGPIIMNIFIRLGPLLIGEFSSMDK